MRHNKFKRLYGVMKPEDDRITSVLSNRIDNINYVMDNILPVIFDNTVKGWQDQTIRYPSRENILNSYIHKMIFKNLKKMKKPINIDIEKANSIMQTVKDRLNIKDLVSKQNLEKLNRAKQYVISRKRIKNI